MSKTTNTGGRPQISYKKRLVILETILQKYYVKVDELVSEICRNCACNPADAVKAIDEYFQKVLNPKGFTIEKTKKSIAFNFMALRWKHTHIWWRLQNAQSMTSKRKLAKAAMDSLVSETTSASTNKREISSIMLSTGVSVFTFTQELLRRLNEVDIGIFFTTSQLTIDAFLESQIPGPLSVKLVVVGGEFHRDTASLKSEGRIGSVAEQIQKLPLDAVVLSFNGLDKQGLWTDEPWEVAQMQTLVRPTERSKLCIIIMEWSKLTHGDGSLVGGTELMTLPNNGNSGANCKTDYFIFTDPPKGDITKNAAKNEILQDWIKAGAKVIPIEGR